MKPIIKSGKFHAGADLRCGENVVIYKLVEGFPAYRVGTDGSVWTRWKKNGKKPSLLGTLWKRLKTNTARGYLQVALQSVGVRVERKVHQLVLETFVGPRPEGMEVCHNDGNKKNNSLSNLRWGTKSENTKDRRNHGNDMVGEKNGRAKLTKDTARAIRDELRTTGASLIGTARKYGISRQMAERLKYGWQWKCLDEEDQSCLFH